MTKNRIITIKGKEVAIIQHQNTDFISLTDMVKGFGDDTMIYSWMRNRNTLEFIGIWEEMNNPDFKGNEFVTFKSQAGLNNYKISVKGMGRKNKRSDFMNILFACYLLSLIKNKVCQLHSIIYNWKS